jgi:hypothetical protein
MKPRIFLLLSLFIYLLAFNHNTSANPKKFNLGIGTYALTLAYDNPFVIDDDFSGSAFHGSYAFTNNFAIRGNFYSMEHDVISILEVSGADLIVQLGSGMENLGFKAYIGGGLYTEDWDVLGLSDSFSGLQLNAGLGYNWDVIFIDGLIGFRDTSDYDDLVTGTNITAVTISLSIGARF